MVLLVCADVLTGLFALLAPLALLVFVPPVAVALLAVVPPPATAANGRRRTEVWKGQRRGEERGDSKEMWGRGKGREWRGDKKVR